MPEDHHGFDEFTFQTDSWRIFRILSEFVDGFETLVELGPSVSLFGSARIQKGHPFYVLSMEVAKAITEKGFSLITGGGPGLMEAANEGAQIAGGKSCGLGVQVPYEKDLNAFIDPAYKLKFRYFFIRKVMFIRYAQGFVFLPGGYGTMDELFEALTLIYTKKIAPFPIFLVGKEYWEGLLDWIKKSVMGLGCLNPSEFSLIQVSDDPNEIAQTIDQHYRQNQT